VEEQSASASAVANAATFMVRGRLMRDQELFNAATEILRDNDLGSGFDGHLFAMAMGGAALEMVDSEGMSARAPLTAIGDCTEGLLPGVDALAVLATFAVAQLGVEVDPCALLGDPTENARAWSALGWVAVELAVGVVQADPRPIEDSLAHFKAIMTNACSVAGWSGL